MNTLQIHNTSAQVTIPKDGLRRDGVIEDDFPDDFEQNCIVDRLGKGQYLIRLVDVDGEGDVPDLLDAEVVRRAAVNLLLSTQSAEELTSELADSSGTPSPATQ